MANEKMTKRESFTEIIKVLEGAEREDLVKVVRHELELMDAKNAKRASQKVDNSGYFEMIEKALAGSNGMTPTELVAKVGLPNTQKLASIVKSMDNRIVREVKGKKVLYKLAD